MTRGAKDERLAAIAGEYNVAQFVSFSAGQDPSVRFSRVRGRCHDEALDVVAAVQALLDGSEARLVNIRSFLPDRDKGNPFHRDIGDAPEAARLVRSLASQGYVTIVNEVIDVHDGGVSGVKLNDVIEFVPGDTPRGVEGVDVASMSYDLGSRMLRRVYGLVPDLPGWESSRIEFSVHPLRVGYRRDHTIVWEYETVPDMLSSPDLRWPNKFSRFLGDKAFGLLVADLLGLAVPFTTVISRWVPPFQFGQHTSTGEVWSRPCPSEQKPGLYPTTRGWTDPYQLLRLGEPEGAAVAAVLAQEGVDAIFSGATRPAAEPGNDQVEGVAGFGDRFMQGEQLADELPGDVVRDVRAVARRAVDLLGGPVRLEFAHDGKQVWILQLHQSSAHYGDNVIFPGAPRNGWFDFHPDAGLDALRSLIERAEVAGNGIVVRGSVGVTSHVGDLLRRAKIPSVRRTTAEQ